MPPNKALPSKTRKFQQRDFLKYPGFYFFTLDDELNVTWKSPRSGSSDQEEILGRVRETIIRTYQTESPKARALNIPIVKSFQLNGTRETTRTFVMNIDYDKGNKKKETCYKIIVQDITECVPGLKGKVRTLEKGALSIKSYRKLLHDLSNPLSIISGFAEYMLSNMPEDDDNREFVVEIFTSAGRLRKVLEKAKHFKKSLPKTKNIQEAAS